MSVQSDTTGPRLPPLPREIHTNIIANIPVYDLPTAWVKFRLVSPAWKDDTEYVFSVDHIKKLTIRLPEIRWRRCELRCTGVDETDRELAIFQSVEDAPDWPATLNLSDFSQPIKPIHQVGRESEYPVGRHWMVYMENVTASDPPLVGLEVHGDPQEKKLKLPWKLLLNQLFGEELDFRGEVKASIREISNSPLADRPVPSGCISFRTKCYLVNLRAVGLALVREVRLRRTPQTERHGIVANGSLPFWETRYEIALTWAHTGGSLD